MSKFSMTKRNFDFSKLRAMYSLPFLALLCQFWSAQHQCWSPDTPALESTK